MKNSLRIYLLLIISMITMQAHSQKLYVLLSGGYGIPFAPNTFAATNQTQNSGSGSNNTTSYERIKGSGSFGKGTQFLLAIGYNITPVISMELGMGYLLGSTITNTSTNISANSTQTTVSTISANMLRLIPSVRFTTANERLNPYIKFGLVIGLGGKLNAEVKNTHVTSNKTDVTESTQVFSGGTAFGISSALGLKAKINNSVDVFGEIGIITQSWSPSKSVTTKSTDNGIDQLSTLTTNEKEINYVDSYTTSNSNGDPNSPRKEIKYFFPFSSVGINIGLHYNFGK